MSSTIEISRQYPAKTPPNKKTYLAYPAILKTYPAGFCKKHTPLHHAHVQCCKFFHPTLSEMSISQIFSYWQTCTVQFPYFEKMAEMSAVK